MIIYLYEINNLFLIPELTDAKNVMVLPIYLILEIELFYLIGIRIIII